MGTKDDKHCSRVPCVLCCEWSGERPTANNARHIFTVRLRRMVYLAANNIAQWNSVQCGLLCPDVQGGGSSGACLRVWAG
jgi:hypothetical protein